MVTVTLRFNKEKLKKLGRTVDEMLEPIRKTLAHFHIEEIEQGVFHSDSDDGTIVQGVMLKFMIEYSYYLQFLDSWTVEADGVKETCTSAFWDWNPPDAVLEDPRIFEEKDEAVVTVTFRFKEEKLKELGKSVDEMLEPIRESLENHDVEEIEQGIFRKTGREGLMVLTFPLMYIRKHLDYLDYLDDWLLNVDGDVEDCKAELISYERNHPDEFNKS